VDVADSSIVADRLAELLANQGVAEKVAGRGVLVGLVGRGIQASRTPAMHEREGARLGLNYRYVLLDFDLLGLPEETLGEVIAAADHLGFAGLNVTHPFKQHVIPHLSRLARQAEGIGAVNTVVFRDGESIGHNTDSWGFAASFREGMAGSALDRVVQFGAGGAGAAVACALLDLGVADLAIIDTDPARSHALADRLARRFGPRVRAAQAEAALLARTSGIVNTTPVGMTKYPGTPFPAEWLTPRPWVAEVVYFPEETELLRQARALGCRTLAGTGMAVYQAVRAFELFTGMPADPAAMIAHFEAAA